MVDRVGVAVAVRERVVVGLAVLEAEFVAVGVPVWVEVWVGVEVGEVVAVRVDGRSMALKRFHSYFLLST